MDEASIRDDAKLELISFEIAARISPTLLRCCSSLMCRDPTFGHGRVPGVLSAIERWERPRRAHPAKGRDSRKTWGFPSGSSPSH